MKICAKCGRINEDSEIECTGCGEPLGESVKRRRQRLVTPVAPSNCPTCGQTPRAWDIYCGQCGTKLSPTQSWPNKRINKKVFIVMAGIVLVVCASVGVKKITKMISRSNAYYMAACKNENGKWGYIDEKGNVVVDFIYDEAGPFDENGYAIVGAKQTDYMYSDSIHYGVIDTSGKEVVLCQNKQVANWLYEYGYFPILRFNDIDDTYIGGVANVDGNVMIDYSYFDDIDNIGDSGFFIAHDKNNSNYGIINADKEWVVDPEYSELYLLVNSKYEPIKVNEEFALVAKNVYGRMGIINVYNEVLLPFNYQYVSWSSDKDEIVARNNDGWGVLDLDLKEIIPFRYSEIFSFSEDGYGTAANEDGYYIIDTQGNELYLPGVDGTIYFVNGLCAASVNGRWGVINNKGEWIIEPTYDYIDVYEKYIVCELYEPEFTQSLFNHSGNFLRKFDENKLLGWQCWGCDEALPVVSYSGVGYGAAKSSVYDDITPTTFEEIDVMDGWINLYDYGYGSGKLISPAGDIVDESYTKYFVDRDTDYITAWEEYYGDTEYLTRSHLLDKDGTLIKSFDDFYCVGVFKKVR